MDERDRKIVTLTHELVRSNMVLGPHGVAPRSQITFKTLCFAALLAAGGGGMITEVSTQLHRPINRYEKTEINALLFYASREKNLDEKELRNALHTMFNIKEIDDMTAQEFNTARRYLQDKVQ